MQMFYKEFNWKNINKYDKIMPVATFVTLIVLSVFRFIDSDYHFSIFKPFLTLINCLTARNLSHDPLTNVATKGNSCFWLANFKKSSPLKPHGQLNRNLVGSICGRSSIKIANFGPIRKQTLPPQAILVSDRSIQMEMKLSIFIEDHT
jgi:hypothetical protein